MKPGLIITLIGSAVFIAVMFGSTTISVAEVTTCFGPQNCVVATPSGSRKLSRSEAAQHNREQQRERIDSIECETANNQAACEKLKISLDRVFR